MTEGSREARSPPSPPASQAVPLAPSEQERYGPLVVERHRKADGRALILYTVPDTASADTASAASASADAPASDG